MPVLVDSNVLLDIATEDPVWISWSSEALIRCVERDLIDQTRERERPDETFSRSAL